MRLGGFGGERRRAAGRLAGVLLAAALLSAPALAQGDPEEGALGWAGFTTGFASGAPRDRIRVVSEHVRTVYYVSELRGLEGRTVLHRWLREERVAKEVRFEVEAPRFRAVSRHAPAAEGPGPWSVEVVDARSEEVLRRDRLRVLPEASEATPHTAPAAGSAPAS